MDSPADRDRALFHEILVKYASSATQHEALAESLANLTKIDAQIDELLATRDLERARVAVLKHATSALRQFPAEILLQIFSLAKDDADSIFGPANPHHQTVIRLASVCVQWRHTANAAAELWGGKITLPATKTSSSYVTLTKKILRRSSPHPLHIVLRGEYYSPPINPDIVKAVLAVADRWQKIKIDFDIRPWLKGVLPPRDKLEAVTIDLSSSSPGPMFSMFLPAPRLTDLNVTVRACSPDLMRMLSQCAGLRKLELSLELWTADDLPLRSMLMTLACLEELDLSFSGLDKPAATAAPFFASFVFPKLHKVQVSFYDEDAEDEHGDFDDTFVQFLRRCPAVASLYIGRSSMDDITLDRILFSVPALESLTLFLCWECIGHLFFHRLTYRPADPAPFLPRLRSINLSFIGGYPLKDAKTMILSRWWSDAELARLSVTPPVERLHTVCIAVTEDGHENRLPEKLFNRLSGEGLEIWVC
uniref:F-box domain-containing protein n=1 Tax=Mycena chlorophos TaxID=658473 RepID=A0ABQ0KU97_MYCCL|nr:predicted protein [Mycena chlorophos]